MLHGREPFIFVSYVHSDSKRVFAEMQHLLESGFKVYYDERIHPGYEWHDDLADARERLSPLSS